MSEQDNIRIVKETYAAFKRRDIPGVLNSVSDDVDWFVPGPTEILPVSGRRRGRDQVAKFFTTLDTSEEIQQFEPQEFIAQGDKVVVTGKYRARIKATGRTAESDWAHIHTLRGGKIAQFREFTDTANAVEAYAGRTATAGKAR